MTAHAGPDASAAELRLAFTPHDDDPFSETRLPASRFVPFLLPYGLAPPLG